MTPLFKKYSQNKEIGTDGLILLRKSSTTSDNLIEQNDNNDNDNNDNDNTTSEIYVHRLESSRNPYSLHLPLPTPTTFINPITPTSSTDDQRLLESNIELPLLETVPSIFFDPNFNLENPRTFDIVCEQT